MTDARDLESSLAEMDRKLRELQRELALVSGGQPAAPEGVPPGADPSRAPAAPSAAPPPVPAPAPPPEADVLEQATARVAELGRRIDELGRLRDDLDSAARALREEQLQAPTPPPPPSPLASPPLPATGDVAVNAGPFPDIATLSAFEHALQRISGVDDAVVRSFEGNRAHVDVRLREPIDLASALRATLPFAFDVVAAGRGELTLTLRLPSG